MTACEHCVTDACRVFPASRDPPYPGGVRVPRPARSRLRTARSRLRTVGLAGLTLLAGVVGGAVAGLLRVPRAGEAA